MTEFFRRSTTWAVEYRYDGRFRCIFKVMPEGSDVRTFMVAELAELYGSHAELGEIRLATEEEERAYLKGENQRNALCPTGRATVSQAPLRDPGHLEGQRVGPPSNDIAI